MSSLPLDRSSGRCLALGVSDRRDHATEAPPGRWTESFLRACVSVIVQTVPISLIQCNNDNGSGFLSAVPVRQGATENQHAQFWYRATLVHRVVRPEGLPFSSLLGTSRVPGPRD